MPYFPLEPNFLPHSPFNLLKVSSNSLVKTLHGNGSKTPFKVRLTSPKPLPQTLVSTDTVLYPRPYTIRSSICNSIRLHLMLRFLFRQPRVHQGVDRKSVV